MSSTRLPDYVPDTIKDKKIHDYLHKFYEASNDPNVHDDFADLFTEDGEYIMNTKKAKGRQEVVTLRKAIWSHIPNRDHSPIQIFTHGTDQMDLMVHGDVTYNHHHGHETGSDWTATIELAKVGDEIKMRRYQIIVDSAAHV